jgi:hypothetical protein
MHMEIFFGFLLFGGCVSLPPADEFKVVGVSGYLVGGDLH